MSAVATTYPLPWRLPDAEARRAVVIQLAALAVGLVLGVAIPWIDLPERMRAVRDAVTMTRITLAPPIEQPRPLDPPPVIEPPRTEMPRVETPVDVVPTPTVARAPVLPRSRPTPAPRVVVPPRDVAADASLAALDDAFGDLRAPRSDTLRARAVAAPTTGPARPDRAALGVDQGQRALAIDRRAGGAVNVALGGRNETRVVAPPNAATTSNRGSATTTASIARQRSLEEVWRVFDANKGSLFALYQAALADAPGLAGKIVVELSIEPSGAVGNARVVSSEIADSALVEQVLRRVRSFRFDAKDVARTTVTYPVHFLPT